MFGTNTVTSSLSLTKILGGISKGLTIANQIIPLYQQTKPIIKNAKQIMNVLKEFNNSNNNNKTTIEVKTKKKTDNTNQSNSLPVFFQ